MWWSESKEEGCGGVTVKRKVVVEWKYIGRLWWSDSKEEGCGGVKVYRKIVVE